MEKIDWTSKIKFNKDKGEIIVSGNRAVIVTAGALKALRDTVTEVMKEETADSVLYMAGKKHTRKLISDILSNSIFTRYVSKFNWGKEKITEKMVDILSQYGMA